MELNTQYRGTLTKRESLILSDLARKNKRIFTIAELKKYEPNAKKISYSLMKKKWIAQLKRGLFAIVPLDIGVQGAAAFAVSNLIVPPYLVKKYYISYGSALQYYGFSEQLLREVLVATDKAKKAVRLVDSKVVFIHLRKKKFFGIQKISLDGKEVMIADKEKAIIDSLEKPQFCGGIEEAAKAIYFNLNELDIAKLVTYGKKMNNSCILKRLGYLLDKLYGKKIKVRLSKNYCLLDPQEKKKGNYNNKWKIIVNKQLDPNQWMH